LSPKLPTISLSEKSKKIPLAPNPLPREEKIYLYTYGDEPYIKYTPLKPNRETLKESHSPHPSNHPTFSSLNIFSPNSSKAKSSPPSKHLIKPATPDISK
jgi:hypothetical protein